ncbi:MAG: transposase, partial [Bacillota bacterium]
MRKKHSPELKAQIVLEMLREEKTITELASQYGLHPNQLHRWRNQALANLPQVFADQDNV